MLSCIGCGAAGERNRDGDGRGDRRPLTSLDALAFGFSDSTSRATWSSASCGEASRRAFPCRRSGGGSSSCRRRTCPDRRHVAEVPVAAALGRGADLCSPRRIVVAGEAAADVDWSPLGPAVSLDARTAPMTLRRGPRPSSRVSPSDRAPPDDADAARAALRARPPEITLPKGPRKSPMKVATWNVNGIRAREAQFVEWVRRDHARRRVPCRRSRPAGRAARRESLTLLPDSPGATGTAGPKRATAACRCPSARRTSSPARPEFSHPGFDVENRASCRCGIGQRPAWSSRASTSPTAARITGRSCASSRRCARYAARRESGRPPAWNPLRRSGRRRPRGHRSPPEGAASRCDRPATRRAPRSSSSSLRPTATLEDVGRATLESPPTTGSSTLRGRSWRSMRQKNQGWRIDYVLVAQRSICKTDRMPRPRRT